MPEMPRLPEQFLAPPSAVIPTSEFVSGEYDAAALVIDGEGRGWIDRLSRPIQANVYQQLGKPMVYVRALDDGCEVAISAVILAGHRWLARPEYAPNDEHWLPVLKFIESDRGREGEELPPEVVEQLMSTRFERWPGFVRLKRRLEFLVGTMGLDTAGSSFLAIDLVAKAPDAPIRVFGQELDLVLPGNEREFEQSGHTVRLAFSATEKSLERLAAMADEDFVKRPIHRATLWAYSGSQNSLTCAYVAQALNDGSREVYLESLGEGRYELGLSASGNLFDSLLLSDDFVGDRGRHGR